MDHQNLKELLLRFQTGETNVEDVIEVIEHVSQDVEIVVQKVKIENKNENSVFKCFFTWFGTIF